MILFVLTARVNMDLLVELVSSVKYLVAGIVMEMPASAPNVTTFWDSMWLKLMLLCVIVMILFSSTILLKLAKPVLLLPLDAWNVWLKVSVPTATPLPTLSPMEPANTTGTNCVRRCNVTGCLECYNSTICKTCGPNSDPSNDMTLCNCDGGFFRSGSNCAACIANCDVCTAATGCTTCNFGYRFNSNSSTCVLSENYVKLAFTFVLLAILSFAMWCNYVYLLCVSGVG